MSKADKASKADRVDTPSKASKAEKTDKAEKKDTAAKNKKQEKNENKQKTNTQQPPTAETNSTDDNGWGDSTTQMPRQSLVPSVPVLMSQRTNDEELEDRSSGPSISFSNNEPNELISTTRGSLGAMSFNNDQEADKLNSRLKHERNVLNEIVRILLAASIVQHPNQRNEAAIKFLIRVDRDNLKPFEKKARRIWYLENKKNMERVFFDPLEKGFDSPIFSDARSMVAINMMWQKRVRPHFLFKSFFMITLYAILLIFVAVRLGARNDRQAPAVRRAIHQQFIDPEWDQYNAETYMDIETSGEW